MFLIWGSKLKSLLESLEDCKRENSILRDDTNFLRQLIEEEKLERKYLTSLILQRTGFEAPSSNVSNVNTNMEPIGRAVRSWHNMKKKLEKDSMSPKVAIIDEKSLEEVDDLIEGPAERETR